VNDTLSNFFKNYKLSVPIWFLRQSGRHIPEYFKLRNQKNNFIDFCLDTELVVKSTTLPLKYYDLDAAIVFSDILMIPWAVVGYNILWIILYIKLLSTSYKNLLKALVHN
jgi:uroporphyrinogen-III decarboxylase